MTAESSPLPAENIIALTRNVPSKAKKKNIDLKTKLYFKNTVKPCIMF